MLQLLFLVMLFLLTACDGPLSLVSYVLAGGVAMHARDEEFAEGQQQQYVEKCLPTHRKEDPVASGERLETAGNRIKAYEYYSIGIRLNYPDAQLALMRLKSTMSQADIATAEKNVQKYSDVHVKTCFVPAGKEHF